MYVTRVPNRTSPPAVLLRESYREGGKVKTRTVANQSDCWPSVISLDLTPIRRRRENRLATEYPPQRLHLGVRPVRQIGDRARLDLATLAVALPQKHRRRRGAVRHARDIHEPYKSFYGPHVKQKCLVTCLHRHRRNNPVRND